MTDRLIAGAMLFYVIPWLLVWACVAIVRNDPGRIALGYGAAWPLTILAGIALSVREAARDFLSVWRRGVHRGDSRS